jgi:hypothetical protein
MKSILNNPYRILGLHAGATTGERRAKINRLRMYLNAGEEPPGEDDYSFPVLETLSRTIGSVNASASKIDLDSDRMDAALFWFYTANSVSDEAAFAALANNDIEGAVGIWSKLASGNVTGQNYSAFQNLSTLLLCRSFQMKSSNVDTFKQGLKLKLQFLESEYREDFVRKVTDVTFMVTKVQLESYFLRTLLRDVKDAKHRSITVYTMIEALESLTFGAKNDFKAEVLNELVFDIKQKMKDAARETGNNPKDAGGYINSLCDDVSNNLEKLKEINALTNTVADSIADEVLNCAIDCRNAMLDQIVKLLKKYEKRSQTVAEANDLLDEAKPVFEALEYNGRKEGVVAILIRKVQSIASGNTVKQRCDENLESLQTYYSKASDAIAVRARNMLFTDVQNTVRLYGQAVTSVMKLMEAFKVMRKIEVMVLSSEVRAVLDETIKQLGGSPVYGIYEQAMQLLYMEWASTIEQANSLLKKASPVLEKLKNAVQTADLHSDASSRIASKAMDMANEYIIEVLQEKRKDTKAYITLAGKLAKEAGALMEKINKMDIIKGNVALEKQKKMNTLIDELRRTGRTPVSKQYTEICGFIKVRGGAWWATIKYFVYVTLIAFGALVLLESQWHALSEPSDGKFMRGLPYFVVMMWFFFAVYGIVSVVISHYRFAYGKKTLKTRARKK